MMDKNEQQKVVKTINNFTIVGENVLGEKIVYDDVTRLLENLERKIIQKGHSWKDVSLLMLANSKITNYQNQSDQSIIFGLNKFCNQRKWFPSLIGLTVVSSFFGDDKEIQTDIDNGLTFVAIKNRILEKLPVSIRISSDDEQITKSGVEVIEDCLDMYVKLIKNHYNISMSKYEAITSTSGILFTTGTRRDKVDLMQAVSQSILKSYSEFNIIGGCSSNRRTTQMQCHYYSKLSNGEIEYKYEYSYEHVSLFTLIPYTAPISFLEQPYIIHDKNPLHITFSNYSKYEDGRYFNIEKINNKNPLTFFKKYWQIENQELLNIEKLNDILPNNPKTHKFTIGSSKSIYEEGIIWPNIPLRIKTIDNKRMLSIIRAEARDSNFYLMKLEETNLKKNCMDLAKYYDNTIGSASCIIVFLCESRKYLLKELGRNDEAETLLSQIPSTAIKIGFYVNGEYSFGNRKSIGYHNFSLISSIYPYKNMEDLPFNILSKLLETKKVKIFLSHASRDKAIVNKIRDYFDIELQQYIDFWIDEEKILIGAHLKETIKQAIDSEAEYFIVFISQFSIKSKWVENEVQWGILKEKNIGRTFILPVLLDDVLDQIISTWTDIDSQYLMDKKYLKCFQYSDWDLKFVGTTISENIKEWIIRDNLINIYKF